ncbi:hypothetical protein BH23ACT5_BH23ACT5_24660 [soil metagenome]
MSMREKIEESASDFLESIAVPAAERVREGADDLLGRLGSESRQLSDRLGSQLSNLPEVGLRRLDLVPARHARRRFIFGLLAGLSIGAALAYLFDSSKGSDRRAALTTRLGLKAPEPAAAATENSTA